MTCIEPIKRTFGNTANFVVALTALRLENGEPKESDYNIQEGDIINVSLKGLHKYEYTPTYDENYLYFSDNGDIEVGRYDLEVKVTTKDGVKYRAFEPGIYEVVRPSQADATRLTDDDVLLSAGIAMVYVDGKFIGGIDDIIVSESTADGGNNTITIKYGNGKTRVFHVKNGQKGADANIAGANAAIAAANTATSNANSIYQTLMQAWENGTFNGADGEDADIAGANAAIASANAAASNANTAAENASAAAASVDDVIAQVDEALENVITKESLPSYDSDNKKLTIVDAEGASHEIDLSDVGGDEGSELVNNNGY